MKLTQHFFLIVMIVMVNAANADVVLSRVDDEVNPNWRTNPHLRISNEITKGDYEKTLNAVKETYVNGDIGQLYVTLNSPGGDILEAMKIGSLVRKLKLNTFAILGQCNSACVFILVAGAERSASGGAVGIHRPFFEKEYFSGLSTDEAQKKYDKLMAATEGYLAEMGVAKELIERMFRIPSNEVEQLSLEEVQKWISGSPAALDEWLIAKCGSYTKEERDDYAMWLVQRIDLKPGYVNYLKEKTSKVDGCRMATLSNERKRIAASLFP